MATALSSLPPVEDSPLSMRLCESQHHSKSENKLFYMQRIPNKSV